MENEHYLHNEITDFEITTTALKRIKQEFTHPIPDEYIELSKTADIAPTAPSYTWSVKDIISDEEELDALLKREKSLYDEPGIISDNSLTKTGKFLKDKLKDNTLIDLGCGDQSFVQNMAHAFGAKRYLGVDIKTSESVHKNANFESYRLRNDMLLFVSSLPDNYGSFFIAGAEDYSGDVIQEGVDVDIEPSVYMQALLKEIHRATKPGSVLIIGANNTLPNPRQVGFKHIKCAEDKISNTFTFVFLKD